jgi:hypothetical protein
MASNAVSSLGRIFYEPAATFSRLKDNPSPWLPALALIVLTAAVMYWWIGTLDFGWLREHMAAGNPDMKGEARAAMDHMITPSTMLWATELGIVFGTMVVFTISALYYLLAGKLIGSSIGFGKWFGFVSWTSVPKLLVIPLMALQIATSHGQIAAQDLNMVSMNFLLLHLPQTHPWATLADSVDIAAVWSTVLAVIGLKAWTGRSTATCATIALLPALLIYGAWAAKILFFA